MPVANFSQPTTTTTTPWPPLGPSQVPNHCAPSAKLPTSAHLISLSDSDLIANAPCVSTLVVPRFSQAHSNISGWILALPLIPLETQFPPVPRHPHADIGINLLPIGHISNAVHVDVFPDASLPRVCRADQGLAFALVAIGTDYQGTLFRIGHLHGLAAQSG